MRCCHSDLVLGDRDEIGTEEHARHAFDVEQTARQRRRIGIALAAEVGRTVFEHGLAGNELERLRIRRRLGLNKHGRVSSNARRKGGQTCL